MNVIFKKTVFIYEICYFNTYRLNASYPLEIAKSPKSKKREQNRTINVKTINVKLALKRHKIIMKSGSKRDYGK